VIWAELTRRDDGMSLRFFTEDVQHVRSSSATRPRQIHHLARAGVIEDSLLERLREACAVLRIEVRE
jgi:hypothetical protein